MALIYNRGHCFLSYCKVCRACGRQTRQVPLRKIGSIMVLECYCPHCGGSEIRYEDFEMVVTVP